MCGKGILTVINNTVGDICFFSSSTRTPLAAGIINLLFFCTVIRHYVEQLEFVIERS